MVPVTGHDSADPYVDQRKYRQQVTDAKGIGFCWIINKEAAAITIKPRISAEYASLRFVCRNPRMQTKPVTRIGRSAPEYLLAMAAPSDRPVVRLFRQVGRSPCRQNRYKVSIVNVPTGTSVVISIPCASKFGQKE